MQIERPASPTIRTTTLEEKEDENKSPEYLLFDARLTEISFKIDTLSANFQEYVTEEMCQRRGTMAFCAGMVTAFISVSVAPHYPFFAVGAFMVVSALSYAIIKITGNNQQAEIL